jgi:hypothetical protein
MGKNKNAKSTWGKQSPLHLATIHVTRRFRKIESVVLGQGGRGDGISGHSL